MLDWERWTLTHSSGAAVALLLVPLAAGLGSELGLAATLSESVAGIELVGVALVLLVAVAVAVAVAVPVAVPDGDPEAEFVWPGPPLTLTGGGNGLGDVLAAVE